MNQQQYDEELAALQREIPELLADIREYAIYARLSGDTRAAEQARDMAEFVEEISFDVLHPGPVVPGKRGPGTYTPPIYEN